MKKIIFYKKSWETQRNSERANTPNCECAPNGADGGEIRIWDVSRSLLTPDGYLGNWDPSSVFSVSLFCLNKRFRVNQQKIKLLRKTTEVKLEIMFRVLDWLAACSQGSSHMSAAAIESSFFPGISHNFVNWECKHKRIIRGRKNKTNRHFTEKSSNFKPPTTDKVPRDRFKCSSRVIWRDRTRNNSQR